MIFSEMIQLSNESVQTVSTPEAVEGLSQLMLPGYLISLDKKQEMI